MGKDSFILYTAQYDAISAFSREQKGELLEALFEYVINGNVPTIEDKEVSVAFAFFRIQLDGDMQRYKEKCEKNKRIAQERWESKKSERVQTDTNVNERMRTDTNVNERVPNEYEYDNEYDNDNDFYFSFLETEKQKKQNKEEFCQNVMKYYNMVIEKCGCQLRPVKVLSEARKQLIVALAPLGNKQIAQGIINAARSNYLNGRTKARTRPADFDWIMRYENFVKCVEGTL